MSKRNKTVYSPELISKAREFTRNRSDEDMGRRIEFHNATVIFWSLMAVLSLLHSMNKLELGGIYVLDTVATAIAVIGVLLMLAKRKIGLYIFVGMNILSLLLNIGDPGMFLGTLLAVLVRFLVLAAFLCLNHNGYNGWQILFKRDDVIDKCRVNEYLRQNPQDNQ